MERQRKLKARYQVRGPRKEMVQYTRRYMDENKTMQSEEVSEEMDVYWVLFPQGHSIRVTSFDRLKQLGFHLKPRIIDMETGDVVEVGGDPYEFGNDPFRDEEITLVDDDDTTAKKSRAKAL